MTMCEFVRTILGRPMTSSVLPKEQSSQERRTVVPSESFGVNIRSGQTTRFGSLVEHDKVGVAKLLEAEGCAESRWSAANDDDFGLGGSVGGGSC